MGLGRWRRRHSEERAGTQDWWNYAQVPGLITASAYARGGLEQTLRNAASWACIDVLADAMGRTPFDAYTGASGAARPVTPTPSLLTQPSGIVQVDVWQYQLAFSMVTDGNAFGRITTMTRGGWPATVELLDPVTVTQRKVVGGIPEVLVDGARSQLYPFGDLWHVPGRVVRPGSPYGLSPVDYASQVVGTSLSAEDFSHQYFDGGGHPTAIIYGPAALTEPEARAIKDSFRTATSGNSREPAVMGSDLKYQEIQSSPGDTQSIDTMRFAVEQVCRFWRVPPSMVYGAVSGQSVTYANVSDADLALLKWTLDGYFVRVENALTSALPKPQYVKANRNAILRGDVEARYRVHEVAIRNRLRTPNEARALEDEPPLTDGTGDLFYGPVAPGRAEPQVPGDAPAVPPAGPAPPTKPTPKKPA